MPFSGSRYRNNAKPWEGSLSLSTLKSRIEICGSVAFVEFFALLYCNLTAVLLHLLRSAALWSVARIGRYFDE